MLQSILASRAFRKEVQLYFSWKIDLFELWRQMKIGIPITLQLLSYASYRYAERIVILWYYTVYELGLVSLGLTAMNNLLHLSLIGPKLRKVHISELLGQKAYKEAHSGCQWHLRQLE